MRKEELISLTKSLISLTSLKDHEEDLKTLKKEYRRLIAFEGESFYEKQLVDEFVSLFEELAKKDPSLIRSPLEEKRAIIEEMKTLISKGNLKDLSKQMDTLIDNFKHAGRCEKETDDALWQELRQLQKEAREKVNSHYEEIRKSFQKKQTQKQAIIEEAKKGYNDRIKYFDLQEYDKKAVSAAIYKTDGSLIDKIDVIYILTALYLQVYHLLVS